mmetsp:Transcript_65517/g.73336  ORF Transcript_65517/g.73336 Transcript_65517/m.73336 type:complete len:89 (+) Transcript_65517:386-652(+)
MNHTPRVTVGGKEVTIWLKGLSKNRVYVNEKCTFAHIFVLDKIINGVRELNTWALDTDGVKWNSQKVSAAAAKVKQKVPKEDPGKKDE